MGQTRKYESYTGRLICSDPSWCCLSDYGDKGSSSSEKGKGAISTREHLHPGSKQAQERLSFRVFSSLTVFYSE